MQRARGPGPVAELIENAPAELKQDRFLGEDFLPLGPEESWTARRDQLVANLRVSLIADRSSSGQPGDATKSARKILSHPSYRDPGVKEQRNWLSKSLEQMARSANAWLENLFNRRPVGRLGGAPGLLAGSALDVFVWSLLIVGLLVFAIFVALKFSAAKRAHRQKLSLLDEDEPDYTADEWLQKADELTRESRYREAVRCLYLASLTRLDEAGHLTFVRADTNWEHLHRFEANAQRPTDVDLRTATKEFDRVWYGYQVKGMPDVEWFREFYAGLLQKIGRSG